jgi:hypothetical protein
LSTKIEDLNSQICKSDTMKKIKIKINKNKNKLKNKKAIPMKKPAKMAPMPKAKMKERYSQ